MTRTPHRLLATLALVGLWSPSCGILGGSEGDDAYECSDGADNDDNGDFDCDDEGCVGSPDCADTADGGNGDSHDGNADADGDGYSYVDEVAAGTNPDDPDDHPYLGGWPIDASCRDDLVATGNTEGLVTDNFGLLDQFGEIVRLWDFCGKAVMLVAGAGWDPGSVADAPGEQTTYEHYRDRGFITIYLLGQNARAEEPKVRDLKAWADAADLTIPVLADPDWTVSGRFEVDGCIPSWTLLGPGAKVLIADAVPAVFDRDIENALPEDY